MVDAGPSFERMQDEAFDRRISDIYSCLPGKVTRVDVTLGQCDVQPLIKKRYLSGDVVDLPVITNVPIGFMRCNAGNTFISLPVKVNDTGMIHFSQRSLDLWLASTGQVPIDPKDPRKFDISDGIFYPGLMPFTIPLVGSHADNIVIRNGIGGIEITPDGKFLFQGAGVDLISILIGVIDAVLSTPLTNNVVEGAPAALTPAVIAALEAEKAKLETMQ